MNKKRIYKLAIIASALILWIVIKQYEIYLVDVALSSYSFLPLRVVLYFFILILGGIIYYLFVPLEKLNLYISVPFYVFTIFIVFFIFGFLDASLTSRITIFYVFTILPVVLWKQQKKLELKDFTAFLAAFIIVALVSLLLRMWSPTVEYKYSECWMDMAIFTNSMRTLRLPLEDPWFSGHYMPYYYGGHYGFATLSLVSLLNPDYAINVVSASVLVLIFLASYGFSIIFIKNRKLAILISTFITFGVNIYPFALFIKYIAKKFIFGVEDSYLFYLSTRHLTPAYLIPAATHHVPIVDFFQKELHANYMASPFIITYLWLLYNIRDKDLKSMILIPYLGFFIPLFTWSWPVMALLTFLVLGVIYGIISVLGSFLVFLPYLKTIILGGVSGVKIIYPNSQIPSTPVWAIFVIFLPFILIAYTYIALTSRSKTHLKLLAISILVPLPLLFTRYAAMYFLTIILIYFLLRKDENKFLRVVIFVGLLTIIACDFGFVDDIYGGIWERFNTIFKFYETAWIILMTSLPMLIFRLKERMPKRYPYLSVWKVCRSILFVVLIISVTYVPLAAYSIKNPPLAWDGLDKDVFTLDGSGVLMPNDKAVIKILRKLPRGVLVEMCGFDFQGNRGYIVGYNYFARISSFSGNPTIIGWQNHEYVWRGINAYLDIINRSRDVMEFYKNPTRENLIYLKEKYNVRYIVISSLESEFIISNTNYMSVEKWKSTLLETGLVKEIVNTTSYAIYEVTEGAS